jgi:hypothetical protein
MGAPPAMAGPVPPPMPRPGIVPPGILPPGGPGGPHPVAPGVKP